MAYMMRASRPASPCTKGIAMRDLGYMFVCASLLIISCNQPESSIGQLCEVSRDCGSEAACVFGACVEDDFFEENSPEGAPHGGGGTAIELESSCFQLPITPYQITGYHHGASVGGGKVHAGDDCYGPADTQVRASYEGTVYFAGEAGSWGGLVEIEHRSPIDDSTFYTIYGHLDAATLMVSLGQQVKNSDPLGVLGTRAENGNWDEHLHFSVYTGVHPANNVLRGHVTDLAGYQDPIPWLLDNCPG
jgi:hypothetical protein